MSYSPIFKWNGNYYGFIQNGYLFDAFSNYLGWVEDDGTVWGSDGNFVGEITENEYILRNTSMMAPMPKIPKIPPVPPVPPIPSINKVGKIGKIGWVDPYENL